MTFVNPAASVAVTAVDSHHLPGLYRHRTRHCRGHRHLHRFPLLRIPARDRLFDPMDPTAVPWSARMAKATRRKQASGSMEIALRERVKELDCLYAIARNAARPRATLQAILQEVAECVRKAWQFPEIASARIVIDGRVCGEAGSGKKRHTQSAEIVTHKVPRGAIEVAYSKDKPKAYEGPFLKEERNLINTVARQIASIVEHHEAEGDKALLQEQLRHADRLATIGQLAAGVAHELNEPLGGVLGFVQLARKCPGLPEQVTSDLDRIQAAALHARDVVRKLLLFARQAPPARTRLDLNRLVEEGLQLLRPHCEKEGVDVLLSLSPGLPPITADAGQLRQVLANLVVNSLQAMPDGGKLTIQTGTGRGQVMLAVEDTGVGIKPEAMEKLFIPFFTTKDVGIGTGLGLPVAYGIVTAHGGRIGVHSAVGEGSRFEVWLPTAEPGSPGGGV